MKRLFVFLLSAMLLFASTHAESATATLQKLYAQAELLMVQGDYIGAAAKFESLGAYSDASQMTMYCKAIAAAETMGLYSMAVDAFNDLGEFKDSKQMAKYYEGRDYEAAGEIDVTTASDASLDKSLWFYEEAEKIYGGLAFFKDSLTRMVTCGERIDKIKSEQNRRAEAKKEATYQSALALEQSGDYAEALKLYRTIKGYKDSDDRISICQTAINEDIYQKALALEQSGDYAEAIKLYQSINGYLDSAERSMSCQKEAAYREALELIGQKQYGAALVVLAPMTNYKDSENLMKQCQENIPVQSMHIDSYTVGKTKIRNSSTTTYYTYNAKGHLVSSLNSECKEEYVTDENGNIISSIESGKWSSSNTFVSRKTYNENGDVIRKETEYQAPNNATLKAWTSIYTYQYIYDNAGRIKEYVYEYLGVQKKYRYEYKLDDNGKVVEKKEFLDGKESSTSTYTYNQYGLLELVIQKGVPDADSAYSLTEYKYVYHLTH